MDSRHHIVWIDLETGGTEPGTHQITQIGAVATTGLPELEEVANFEIKVDLVKGMFTEEALDVQNYSEEAWMFEGVPIKKALGALSAWLPAFTHERISKRTGNLYSVAHMAGFNVDFDGDFLRAAGDFCNTWIPLTNWTGGKFDVLQQVKWWYFKNCKPEPESFKLVDLCALWGIQFNAHDAMNDIRATIDLSKHLLTEGF